MCTVQKHFSAIIGYICEEVIWRVESEVCNEERGEG